MPDERVPSESTLNRSLTYWLQLWFLLRHRVGRREYLVSGCGLMLVKYLMEAFAILGLAGELYTPLDFLNPLMEGRAQFFIGSQGWFQLAWALWTLPFVWIAVSMSVRRALNAGISPWHGLWMLVPLANLVAMLVLATLPKSRRRLDAIYSTRIAQRNRDGYVADPVWAVLGGIAIGTLYATLTIQAMITLFSDYGAALFFGTPIVTGMAASYIVNFRQSRSWGASFSIALAAIFFSLVALLLFALEGAICLVMAAPIMLPLAALGAPLGKFLADRRHASRRGMLAALVAVPMVGSLEAQLPRGPELVVTSSIDIAASPHDVWRQVISFPDIDERPEWYFRLGIACPIGAKIDKDGVGATRECIFTTGRFVEPITVWDAPRRLAFDVRQQPEPMFELTPYRDLHPPHLEGAFRSTRGEFELVPTENGGTRLVGRTWYTLDIRPLAYWTFWTDSIVHRIHLRVLRHIKRRTEG